MAGFFKSTPYENTFLNYKTSSGITSNLNLIHMSKLLLLFKLITFSSIRIVLGKILSENLITENSHLQHHFYISPHCTYSLVTYFTR